MRLYCDRYLRIYLVNHNNTLNNSKAFRFGHLRNKSAIKIHKRIIYHKLQPKHTAFLTNIILRIIIFLHQHHNPLRQPLLTAAPLGTAWYTLDLSLTRTCTEWLAHCIGCYHLLQLCFCAQLTKKSNILQTIADRHRGARAVAPSLWRHNDVHPTSD